MNIEREPSVIMLYPIMNILWRHGYCEFSNVHNNITYIEYKINNVYYNMYLHIHLYYYIYQRPTRI